MDHISGSGFEFQTLTSEQEKKNETILEISRFSKEKLLKIDNISYLILSKLKKKKVDFILKILPSSTETCFEKFAEYFGLPTFKLNTNRKYEYKEKRQ